MENAQNIIKEIISFMEECKINKSNKLLMIEKVLSYSNTLQSGIDKYKAENHRFTIFILLSIISINFPIISLPCCLIATIFLIKMLQLIKYRSICNIVNKIGADIAYKGIYNKLTIEEMIEEFKFKYGEEIIEYYELVYVVKNYEEFVVKIEQIVNNIHNKREDMRLKEDVCEDKINFNESYIKINEIDTIKKDSEDLDSKYSFIYKNEEGEIKKVNRAIEFFDDKNKTKDAVVLKVINKKDKNLTVYLYRKVNELQNNLS